MQTLLPVLFRESLEDELDVSFYAQRELLAQEAHTGTTQLLLAHLGLDVAKDQLPSPWSVGPPAGKDICQREAWQLYFLFHLGLSLIHTSCSSPFPFTVFLFSHTPLLHCATLIHHLTFQAVFLSIPIFCCLLCSR